MHRPRAFAVASLIGFVALGARGLTGCSSNPDERIATTSAPRSVGNDYSMMSNIARSQ